MHELQLGARSHAPRSFLFVGAHADDIEIGCGATVRKLVARFPDAEYRWVVLTSDAARAQEAQRAAESFLRGAAHASIEVGDFRDGYLPYLGVEVKDHFEELKTRCSPEMIFTPYHRDAHQDHRLAAELTWNTFRDHVIFEYEVPKYDGDLGAPNVFVEVDEEECAEKVRLLLEHYPSQHARSWFEESTFRALMRLRGMECKATSGLAEAFYARKTVVRI